MAHKNIYIHTVPSAWSDIETDPPLDIFSTDQMPGIGFLTVFASLEDLYEYDSMALEDKARVMKATIPEEAFENMFPKEQA